MNNAGYFLIDSRLTMGTPFGMKLPAAAYSAEVATSATKAGSYGVFGEGE
jgi:hypothetical protein